MWIGLAELLVKYWNIEVLIKIGDSLSCFVGIDKDFLNGSPCSMTKLFSDFDLNVGIMEELEIIFKNGILF